MKKTVKRDATLAPRDMSPAQTIQSASHANLVNTNLLQVKDIQKINGLGTLSPEPYRISIGNQNTCDDTMDCNAYDDQYIYNLPYANIEFANDIWIKNMNTEPCQECQEGHVQPFKASTNCHSCDINTYEPRTGQIGDVTAAFFDHRIYDQPDNILESNDGAITIDTCIQHAKNQYHFVQLHTSKCHLWTYQPTTEKHPKYYEIVKGSIQNNPQEASHFQVCITDKLSKVITRISMEPIVHTM